jgi:hypothetical protein
MPPKPKAFTPARRGASPSQGSTSAISRKRVSATAAAGSSTWRVGGNSPWYTARAALISPAAPAAGMAWPIIDFTDPSPARGRPAWAGPNTVRRVSSSVRSPTGVAVPWASTKPTAEGSRPLARHAASTASTWPSGRGLMRLASRPSLATPVPRITA